MIKIPYIRKDLRKNYHYTGHTGSCGELNYAITQLCKEYLEDNGEKYQIYNDIIGALEGAKLELYRRKVSIYEDKKCEENGDIW